MQIDKLLLSKYRAELLASRACLIQANREMNSPEKFNKAVNGYLQHKEKRNSLKNQIIGGEQHE